MSEGEQGYKPDNRNETWADGRLTVTEDHPLTPESLAFLTVSLGSGKIVVVGTEEGAASFTTSMSVWGDSREAAGRRLEREVGFSTDQDDRGLRITGGSRGESHSEVYGSYRGGDVGPGQVVTGVSFSGGRFSSSGNLQETSPVGREVVIKVPNGQEGNYNFSTPDVVSVTGVTGSFEINTQGEIDAGAIHLADVTLRGTSQLVGGKIDAAVRNDSFGIVARPGHGRTLNLPDGYVYEGSQNAGRDVNSKGHVGDNPSARLMAFGSGDVTIQKV